VPSDDASGGPRRTARERSGRRRARLDALRVRTGNGQTVDERATSARIRVWRGRLSMGDVLVRPELIAHRGSRPSLLRSVSTPKGAAVQMLLLALFEAQCRQAKTLARRPTKLPMRSAPKGGTSWLQLTALPTVDRTSRTSSSRRPDDNRYAQLRTALQVLHRAGRIGVESTGRGRFEGFTLLNESADNLVSEVSYGWPEKNEPVIRVPVEFVINGWIHTLTDNEIITFLHLLQVCGEATSKANPDGWAAIPTGGWRSTFGEDRSFEAHRELTRFGLVDVERPDTRRPDGTVAKDDEVPWEAHRYRVLPERLGFRAVDVVLSALDVKHSLDMDEATFSTRGPFSAVFGQAPDGWTRKAAMTEIEQAKLAAPGHVLLK